MGGTYGFHATLIRRELLFRRILRSKPLARLRHDNGERDRDKQHYSDGSVGVEHESVEKY